jgi:NhaP-type Na+/H+ or K+/H+ antiporter
VTIGLLLLLVVRPLSGMIALAGSSLEKRDRAVIAVYGVRGIGSIYYLAYAAGHIEFIDEYKLWTLVAFVILISTLLHGFTVGWAMGRIGSKEEGAG